MSVSKSAWLVIGVVAGFASGAASFAIAQATQKEVLTTLENNQGILVDKTNFNVIKGASSTGDPLAAMAKMNPREVSAAAIVFRHEEKLLAASTDPERMYRERILPCKLDLYEAYIRTRSFWGDFVILWRTFAAVIGVGPTAETELA